MFFLFAGFANASNGGSPISAAQLAAAREHMRQVEQGTAPKRNAAQGLSAITPHLNLVPASASPAEAATLATLPAFTTEDAVSWVLGSPMSMVKLTAPVTASQVSVKFMTGAEADTLLNMQTAIPATAPACVVQVHASFVAQSSPSMHGLGLTSGDYIIQVFNARTGNLMVTSFASKARW